MFRRDKRPSRRSRRLVKELDNRRNSRNPFGLEPLESREMMAAVVWNVSASGDWNVASNWLDTSTNQPRVPTAADDVTINRPGNLTITVNSAASAKSINSAESILVDTGGGLTVDGDFLPTSGTYTLKAAMSVGGRTSAGGGVIFKAAVPISLNDVDLNGGSLESEGDGVISVGGALKWVGAGSVGGGGGRGVLLVPGSSFEASGTAAKTVAGPLVINTVNARWTGSGSVSGGGAVRLLTGAELGIETNHVVFNTPIENHGLLKVVTGASTWETRGDFVNEGELQVLEGRMKLVGDSVHRGVIDVAAGAIVEMSALQLGSDHTIEAGAEWRGAGTFLHAAGDVSIAEGVDFSVPNYSFTGGIVAGDGQLTVSDHLLWSAGRFETTTVVAAGATASIEGASNKTIDGASLINRGVMNWIGAGQMLSANGGVFQNEGVFNAAVASRLPAPVINTGEFNKTTAGETIVNDYDNRAGGEFHVQAGSLALIQGVNRGALKVDSGATLVFSSQFGADLHKVETGATLEGTGQYRITGGKLEVNIDVTISKLSQEGGAIRGTGTVTISDAMNWTSGNMDAGGVTHIGPGATMNISGTAAKLLNGTLENEGHIEWKDSNLGGTGLLHNLVGGEFEASGDTERTFSPKVTNEGSIVSTSSAGTGRHHLRAAPFQNSGVVSVESGTLLVGAGNSTGDYNASSGARMEFSIPTGGGVHTLQPGAELNGAGAFAVTGLALRMFFLENINVHNLQVDLGNGLFSGIHGPGVVTVTGALDWVNGAMGENALHPGFPRFIVADTATMQVTNHAEFVNATVENFGVATVGESGRMTVSGDFINHSGGVLNLTTDENIGGSSLGLLDNAGVLNSSRPGGSGVTPISGIEFRNSGEVNVLSGALSIARPVDLEGQSLRRGEWNVLAGAALNFPAGSKIVANQGAVSLSGAGSTFAAIDALADNQGEFAILAGRDFSTVGALRNTGKVTIGAESTLDVNGTYSQASELEIQFVGNPASGQSGRLESTGVAALGGELTLRFADGYNPAVDDEFVIATYPGHTGEFSQINRIADGDGRFVAVDENPTETIVRAIANPVDLDVTIVSAPSAQSPGQSVTIDYSVRNNSAYATPLSNWTDSVYLSLDERFDANDTLVGRVTHNGAVAAGGEYNGSLVAQLPAANAGNFRVLVIADSRELVPDFERSNNVGLAANSLRVGYPQLTLGAPIADSFSGPNQDRYYQITPPTTGPLTFTLDSAAGSGQLEIYIRRGAPPTPSQFDHAGNVADQPDQQAVTPIVTAGVPYYILVTSRAGSAASSTFTLLATQQTDLAIASVSPNRAGNGGRATIAIHGENLTTNTQATLVRGGTTLNAVELHFQDESLLYATFDLTGQSLGDYDVRIQDDAAVDGLSSAFTVELATATQNGLEVNLIVPELVRVLRTGYLTVEYVNNSNNDITAPLLEINADRALMTLPESDAEGEQRLVFLGISRNGPAGVLKAGERGRIEIAFTGQGLVGQDINFQVNLAAAPETPMDWQAGKVALRPGHIGAEAWDVVFANFLAEAGSTVGEYEAMLARNATYLSGIGIYTPDVMRLLSLEIDRADAAFTTGSLANVIDSAVQAPGFELSFVRYQKQPIHGRYEVGSFGRSWTHNWEISATTLPDDNVVLGFGAARRFFFRQADGSYRGTAGDNGVLSAPGGAFRLTEDSGFITQFRTDGKLDFVSDLNGNQITAGYDGAGRLTTLTHSSGASIALTWTGDRISRLDDSLGNKVSYAYDAAAEYLNRYSDKYGTHAYTYFTGQGPAREHALKSIDFSDDTHINFTYDDRGRLASEERDGGQERITYSYLAAGELSMTDAVGGVTRYSFDDRGQLARSIDARGRSVSYAYDPDGNMVSSELSQGVAYEYTHDGKGNVLTSRDPLGGVTTFAYDERSNMTAFTDALGRTTAYAYDSGNNLLGIEYVNGTDELFTYRDDGSLTSSINRRGKVIGYESNAAGQITKKTYADGSSIEYIYDSRARLAIARDNSGDIQFEYNVTLDVLEKVTYPDGKFLEFTHNIIGQRTSSVDQDGFMVNYAYDDLGRLDRLTDGNDGLIVDYTFDPAGRLVRKENGNGTYTTYTHNVVGEILSIAHFALGDVLNSRYDYTYDDLGRRESMTLTDSDPSTADGTTAYGYDPLGQLVLVQLPTGREIRYEYDAVGNRFSVTDNGVVTDYEVNDMNEYVAVGDTTYVYDLDGNLIESSTLGVTTRYTFDDENRLTAISGSGNEIAHRYNAIGHRDRTVANATTTNFLIDPVGLWSVTAEYDETGEAIARYTRGLGLVSNVGAGGAAYYDFDANANTVGLTNSAGAYVNRYTYEPFGETLVATATIANPYTYVGEYGVRRQADGMFEMRNRTFDAGIGRFLSNDPINLGGGDENLRRYVGNDPVSAIDPTGLKGWMDVVFDQFKFDPFGLANDITLNSPGADMINDQTHARDNFYRGMHDFGDGLREGAYREWRRWEFKARERFRDQFDKPDQKQKPNKPPSHPGKGGPKGKSGQGGSFDPNDITGPAGFGDENWVVVGRPMTYFVRFENDPNQATLPAQEVVIEHQLDADLDWSTFEFRDFGFGSMRVLVVDGLQSYHTTLEYQNQDGSELLVDVSMDLDLSTGIATWAFRSIDPTTLDLPAGVFDGFLPVDDGTGVGEGYVNFTVWPKKNLASGTPIEQQASIVFDVNEPIVTNTYLNTIDAETPTSRIDPLPSTSHFRSFPVTWTGNDGNGSGAQTYNVFVSINNGPFDIWLDDTALTSDVYPGVFGNTYAFYSVATDGVGFVESDPGSIETTIAVVDPATVQFLNGQVVVTGGPDFDNVTFLPGAAAGSVLVRLNSRVLGPFVSPNKLVAFGQGGNDRISIDRVDGMPPAEFHGGEGNDRLYGAYAADLLYGDAGRDYLEGFNGHDRLFGGDGDDVLQGGNGNDVLYGEGGNDRLRGYVGNDLMFGGAGRDYLNGDDGNNVLVGGDANDRLGAVSGRNILIGGLGRDVAQGGSTGAILISGATIHDASEAAQLALLAEWSSSRTLDQRVSRLTAGVGPGNQYALTLGGTVQNDNNWSTLEGGAGEDWFFKFRRDTLIGFDPLIDEVTE